jgi:hypothetical protein
MADGFQLQGALMNLMINGIEAMRDTTGELSIKSQLREDGQVLISASDTGEGLPTGKVDHSLDAYFSTKSQGTGLGLASTRSIVELHGGRIWAKASSGSAFVLLLGLTVLLLLCVPPASRAQFEPNTERWGMDLRDFVVPENPRPCLDACRANPRCRSFTFRTAAVAGGRPHCWLKLGIPPARYTQGSVSGVVRPEEGATRPPAFELDTDRGGGDFRDFAVPENPSSCYDACRNDGRCKAFSFRIAHVHDDHPHCWLKDAVPPPKFKRGVVSGVVR